MQHPDLDLRIIVLVLIHCTSSYLLVNYHQFEDLDEQRVEMADSTSATPMSAKISDIFNHKLQNEWKLKACCGREYYLTGEIVKWMRRNDTNMQTINAGLLIAEAYEGNYVHYPSSATIANGEDRCLVVFAILLELRYGHLIDDFRRYSITDKRLPVRVVSEIEPLLSYLKKKEQIQDKLEFWDRFQERMWLYCPCSLELGMRSTFLDPVHGRWIMPFCERQRINMKGGTAQVWEVAVQESLVSLKLAAAVGRSKYKDATRGTVSYTCHSHLRETNCLVLYICFENFHRGISKSI